jgi:hypothetical protein
MARISPPFIRNHVDSHSHMKVSAPLRTKKKKNGRFSNDTLDISFVINCPYILLFTENVWHGTAVYIHRCLLKDLGHQRLPIMAPEKINTYISISSVYTYSHSLIAGYIIPQRQ